MHARTHARARTHAHTLSTKICRSQICSSMDGHVHFAWLTSQSTVKTHHKAVSLFLQSLCYCQNSVFQTMLNSFALAFFLAWLWPWASIQQTSRQMLGTAVRPNQQHCTIILHASWYFTVNTLHISSHPFSWLVYNLREAQGTRTSTLTDKALSCWLVAH